MGYMPQTHEKHVDKKIIAKLFAVQGMHYLCFWVTLSSKSSFVHQSNMILIIKIFFVHSPHFLYLLYLEECGNVECGRAQIVNDLYTLNTSV